MKKYKPYLIKNWPIKSFLFFIAIFLLSSFLSMTITSVLIPHSFEYFTNMEHIISAEIKRAQDIFNLFTFLLVLIIGCISASLFYNTILRSIYRLSAAAKKVALGEFDVQLPVNNSKNDELTVLFRNFNTMTRELSATKMLNNSFISNMSHEFRTPISSIQGFASVLYNSDLTEEQKEYAKIILDESARLSGLATNVLKLTKLENQNIVTDKQSFRLDEQIRHCILLMQGNWLKKNISVVVELPEFQFFGNSEMLQQVWLNLLSNAVKFTDEGGEIVVSGSVVANGTGNMSVKISFKDNGIGMDGHTLNHVFDKFFQGQTSHADEGNGLGLALVKRIVDICSGEVVVRSAPGQGAEFIIKLPMEEENDS